jgi:2-iminobutanoate/2-iminopropanoate deaminase
VTAIALVTGCASGNWSDMTVGGRPLIWKQGPGDETEAVEDRAGVVYKRQEAAAAPRPSGSATATRRSPPPAAAAQAAPATSAAPGGYTQAARYGDLLFVSGQIAIDPRTGAFDAGANIEAQTTLAMENVRAILENNRLTMANVVSVTVYLSNITNIAAMDRVYETFFRGALPARSVVEVAKLPRGALVEISVVAGR